MTLCVCVFVCVCVCVRETEREREREAIGNKTEATERERLSEIRQKPPNTQDPTTSSSFKNILSIMMSLVSML